MAHRCVDTPWFPTNSLPHCLVGALGWAKASGVNPEEKSPLPCGCPWLGKGYGSEPGRKNPHCLVGTLGWTKATGVNPETQNREWELGTPSRSTRCANTP